MITIVGADWCPACRRAKKTAQEHGFAFNYVQIPKAKTGGTL